MSTATPTRAAGDSLDIPRFRHVCRSRPLRTLEVLASSDAATPKNEALAQRAMAEGWRYGPHPPIPLRPPVRWLDPARTNRSLEFNLHSWEGLAPVLTSREGAAQKERLHFAVAMAEDWARLHQTVEDEGFAWYDMAIGLRAYRLGYVLDLAAREEDVADDVVATLLRSAQLHLDVLSDDKRFAAHSNHGFFFTAGQLALARRIPELQGAEQAVTQGYERMRILLDTQFSEEGVHREHSPDYHRMVLDTFLGLKSAGLLDVPDIDERSDRIQEALAWFLMPDGTIAPLGDSPKRRMPRGAPKKYTNETLRYALTFGAAGAVPSETARAFSHAGYAVVRDAWPTGEAGEARSYLLQTCAFHSRVHKQADDLSFVWFDRGHELLTDSGRYGYLGRTEPASELWQDGFWYSDPARIYVESTRAHNTIEVDGLNLPRRGAPHYGSALKSAGLSAGVQYTLARVTHWSHVEHTRALLYRPGDWLLVLDRVRDSTGTRHSVAQRFVFAPALELMHAGPDDGVCLSSPKPAVRLHAVSLTASEMVTAVRGRRAPEMLGWVSRTDEELEPCWTSGYRAVGDDVLLATVLQLGDEQPRVVGEAPAPHGTLRLHWRVGDATHSVTVAGLDDDALTVDYTLSCSNVASEHHP